MELRVIQMDVSNVCAGRSKVHIYSQVQRKN